MASAAPRTSGDNPFSVRTVAIVVMAAALAFLGFLFLMAYAPQIKARGSSGPLPLSKSAVGFYGLYKLSEATGRPTELAESEDRYTYSGFMIVTVAPDTDPERLRELVKIRRETDDTNTLYILPKYLTAPSVTKSGWVQNMGTLDPNWSRGVLDIFGRIKFAAEKSPKGNRIRSASGEMPDDFDVPTPATLHYIESGMKPVLTDDGDHIVLGRTDFENGSSDYILADPDLLSNHALKSPAQARAALALVDALRADAGDSVEFDVLLNGVGKRNLLQLMFEPPFLALTLAVIATAILIGIHAFGRFGPAIPEPRAIPFGKRALADNAAVLIARAGAARRMGDRYVALIRERTATALGAGAMAPDDQERWLAGLQVAGGNFAELAAAARNAPNSTAMRTAARALYDWQKEVIRDR